MEHCGSPGSRPNSVRISEPTDYYVTSNQTTQSTEYMVVWAGTYPRICHWYHTVVLTDYSEPMLCQKATKVLFEDH